MIRSLKWYLGWNIIQVDYNWKYKVKAKRSEQLKEYRKKEGKYREKAQLGVKPFSPNPRSEREYI